MILDKYYGESFVRKYEPYRALPYGPSREEWAVIGSPEDKSFKGFGGGMPHLLIAKKDARVTRIALSK